MGPIVVMAACRDGNKIRTHLKPAKPSLMGMSKGTNFFLRMGMGQVLLNGYVYGYGYRFHPPRTRHIPILLVPAPYTHTHFHFFIKLNIAQA